MVGQFKSRATGDYVEQLTYQLFLKMDDENVLMARDKANLDIFWLRDELLEDSDYLPDPDVLAREIVEEVGEEAS